MMLFGVNGLLLLLIIMIYYQCTSTCLGRATATAAVTGELQQVRGPLRGSRSVCGEQAARSTLGSRVTGRPGMDPRAQGIGSGGYGYGLRGG